MTEHVGPCSRGEVSTSVGAAIIHELWHEVKTSVTFPLKPREALQISAISLGICGIIFYYCEYMYICLGVCIIYVGVVLSAGALAASVEPLHHVAGCVPALKFLAFASPHGA